MEKKYKKIITYILTFILLLTVITTSFISFVFFASEYNMKDYDLYNCIYNNAADNGFSNNPYLINKIQNECICFRKHNYTNILEANCKG